MIWAGMPRKLYTGIYIPAISPLWRGFLSKLKNRDEFEGLLKKEGKRRKKKSVIKHTLKYFYEALMTAKKSTKAGKNFKGGGEVSYKDGHYIYISDDP